MSDQYINDRPQPDAAARMLQASDAVSIRVREAIDTRTQAVIDAWLAVAVLLYALAFAFSGTGLIPGIVHTPTDGLSVGFLVLSAFLAASTLCDGLGQSLHRAKRPTVKRRRFVYGLASVLPLLSIGYLAFFAPGASLPVALSVVSVAAAPVVVLAIRSALHAKRAGVRRPEAALSGVLSASGRTGTAVLGLWLGAIGVVTAPAFGLAGIVVPTIFFLFLFGTRSTRIGLDRLAEDWGRTQWTAFGCSYVFTLTLSVVLARTSWDLTVVSVVGGILIAAPVVVAAFRPAPIWEA
ncbi:hypothetical protein K2F54_07595 [Cryobacterium sp. 1639]|uniref:hypothetical protein n=1 Tax=Cryobacterium inferilacus TaxID=2866629 RepID=UPI001C72D41A|nr:hypothetical protein [Cryobacterium sp. 1639]MBX0299840.1 hypothetical protein [Cryobacterium sp. 1639]